MALREIIQKLKSDGSNVNDCADELCRWYESQREDNEEIFNARFESQVSKLTEVELAMLRGICDAEVIPHNIALLEDINHHIDIVLVGAPSDVSDVGGGEFSLHSTSRRDTASSPSVID